MQQAEASNTNRAVHQLVNGLRQRLRTVIAVEILERYHYHNISISITLWLGGVRTRTESCSTLSPPLGYFHRYPLPIEGTPPFGLGVENKRISTRATMHRVPGESGHSAVRRAHVMGKGDIVTGMCSIESLSDETSCDACLLKETSASLGQLEAVMGAVAGRPQCAPATRK